MQSSHASPALSLTIVLIDKCPGTLPQLSMMNECVWEPHSWAGWGGLNSGRGCTLEISGRFMVAVQVRVEVKHGWVWRGVTVLLYNNIPLFQAGCNGRWWKKVRTKVQRGTCSSFIMNWTLNGKTTKENEQNRNSSVWYRIQKQKTTTHNHRWEQAT